MTAAEISGQKWKELTISLVLLRVFLHGFNLFGVGVFDVSTVRVTRDPGAGTTLQLMLSPPTRHLRAHVPMEPEPYETAMRCSQPRVSILVQLESQKYVVQRI